MEGENQLACDFLPKLDGKTIKCNGLRRDYLERVPEVLLVHLKRFEYDVASYSMAKVKEKFTFPMVLNVHRYTRAGVEAADARENQGDSNAERKGDMSEKEPLLSDDANLADSKSADLSDFDYELVGVIVHDGASEQSGHYYSFAKNVDSGEWFKFNDTTVSKFSLRNVESEWFGGKTMVPYTDYTGQPVGNSMKEEMRNNSAYMLVYRRKQEAGNGSGQNSLPHEDLANKKCDTDTKGAILREVWKSNDISIRSHLLFENQFFSFMQRAFAEVSHESLTGTGDKQVRHILDFVDFFERLVAKTRNYKNGISTWTDAISQHLGSCPAACLQILKNADLTCIRENLIRNSQSHVRNAFANIYFAAAKNFAESRESELEKYIESISESTPSVGDTTDVSKITTESETKAKTYEETRAGASESHAEDQRESDPLFSFMKNLHAEILEFKSLVQDSKWRNWGEFFSLIRKMAGVPILRKYMSSVGLHNTLLMFFGGSLPGMERWSVTVKHPQYGPPKFEAVLDAAAAIFEEPTAPRFFRPEEAATDSIILDLFRENTRLSVLQRMLTALAPHSNRFSKAVCIQVLKKYAESYLLQSIGPTLWDMLESAVVVQNEHSADLYKTILQHHEYGIIPRIRNGTCADAYQHTAKTTTTFIRLLVDLSKASKGFATLVQPHNSMLHTAVVWLEEKAENSTHVVSVTEHREESLALMRELAKLCSYKIVEQRGDGPLSVEDGLSVYGWHKEMPSSPKYFDSKTIVIDCPARCSGSVIKIRYRFGPVPRDGLGAVVMGVGAFERVPDIIKIKNPTASSTTAEIREPEHSQSAADADANTDADADTCRPRFQVGDYVSVVHRSFEYTTIDDCPLYAKRYAAVIHSMTIEGETITYRVVYDDGEVDGHVRETFIEPLANRTPPEKNAMRLKRFTTVGGDAEAKETQSFILSEPLRVDRGDYIGVFQVQYPPRMAFWGKWPRAQPVRYKLFIGQKMGAHPTSVGDVVHRMGHSSECPAMSLVVRHDDSLRDLLTLLSEVFPKQISSAMFRRIFEYSGTVLSEEMFDMEELDVFSTPPPPPPPPASLPSTNPPPPKTRDV